MESKFEVKPSGYEYNAPRYVFYLEEVCIGKVERVNIAQHNGGYVSYWEVHPYIPTGSSVEGYNEVTFLRYDNEQDALDSFVNQWMAFANKIIKSVEKINK